MKKQFKSSALALPSLGGAKAHIISSSKSIQRKTMTLVVPPQPSIEQSSYDDIVAQGRYWFLTYKLKYDFLSFYMTKEPSWGFRLPTGDSLSELTFLTKYSRQLEDGSKEQWWQTCERVVNGTISIYLDYCDKHSVNPVFKEFESVEELAHAMYDGMFHFRWLPPGRGIWSMGTYHVNGLNDSSRLQNCSFWSTQDIAEEYASWFETFFLVCMAGVGVGFDTRGADSMTIYGPADTERSIVIEDSKEGWASSTQMIISAFLEPDSVLPIFDYSAIRPAGSPISSGGTAPGPDPLMRLHAKLEEVLNSRVGESLSSRTIVDVCNLIGKSVVAGGIRRTALISLGEASDEDFIGLKDWNDPKNAERMGPDGWGWTSNNTVFVKTGQSYASIVEKIKVNGEPGIYWLDTTQQMGRTNGLDVDVRPDLATGGNPCMEQPLESREFCTLSEIPIIHNEGLSQFVSSAKLALIYGKIVTLMSVGFQDSQEVMNRNRRIGVSITGLAEFAEGHNFETLSEWMDRGYKQLKHLDKSFSAHLGVPESIRITSIKPSGTVSLVAGCTPGVHWPVASDQYVRTIRFSNHDPLLKVFEQANYHIEPALGDPDSTSVVSFPVYGPGVRDERSVTLREKIQMAKVAQMWWADNMVSATFTFLPEEIETIETRIFESEGRLKVMSFLALGEEATYPQSPYQKVSEEEFDALADNCLPIDWSAAYATALDSEQETGCTNDNCSII